MSATIVYFHSMGFVNGVEYGNAITDGYDPIEYDITRAEFGEHFPDSVYWSEPAS